MLVYRVETAKGQGPYRGDGRSEALKDAIYVNEDMTLHPLPHDDGSDVWGRCKGYLFGFDSMRQLVDWFGLDMRDALRADGFHVALYEVPEFSVAHRTHQVAFDRSMAYPLGTQALT